MPYVLTDLRHLIRSNNNIKLTDRALNFIAKFDNKCKVLQETEKGCLVRILYYYRDRQDYSKFEERPRYVDCWVPKSNTKLIKAELSET
jgi:hypothetical protein